MKNDIEIKSIMIKLKEKEIELSPSELNELYEKIGILLGKPKECYPLYPVTPIIIEKCKDTWYPYTNPFGTGPSDYPPSPFNTWCSIK